MTPQESRDLDVAPVGVCEECGQEQLLRRRIVVDLTKGGIGMQPKYLLECGCGVREITQPPNE